MKKIFFFLIFLFPLSTMAQNKDGALTSRNPTSKAQTSIHPYYVILQSINKRAKDGFSNADYSAKASLVDTHFLKINQIIKGDSMSFIFDFTKIIDYQFEMEHHHRPFPLWRHKITLTEPVEVRICNIRFQTNSVFFKTEMDPKYLPDLFFNLAKSNKANLEFESKQ